MKLLNQNDLEFFGRNWPGHDYVELAGEAEAWTFQNAGDCIEVVQVAVARLVLRHMVEQDAGERAHLRNGLDSLILMWRGSAA
jgi:hypothetical protein